MHDSPKSLSLHLSGLRPKQIFFQPRCRIRVCVSHQTRCVQYKSPAMLLCWRSLLTVHKYHTIHFNIQRNEKKNLKEGAYNWINAVFLCVHSQASLVHARIKSKHTYSHMDAWAPNEGAWARTLAKRLVCVCLCVRVCGGCMWRSSSSMLRCVVRRDMWTLFCI